MRGSGDFCTRVLCRPGKVIGYQKILSLASLAHAAQKKRAAGLSSHSFAPIGVKIATRLLCHPAKILSRASLAHAAQKKRAARARAKRARRARERSEQNECAKRTSSPAGLAGGPAG